MERTEMMVDYGQGLERTLVRMLVKLSGRKLFGQYSDNRMEFDGVLLDGEGMTPFQVKAITPRVYHRDIGIRKPQWKRYTESGMKYPKFTCFVLCTVYNPSLGFDYVLYEFDINSIRPWVEDGEFVYIKLDKMKRSDIVIPVEFQKRIEEVHRKYIRETIREDVRGYCQDKFKG
jgi:hypothetical protein